MDGFGYAQALGQDPHTRAKGALGECAGLGVPLVNQPSYSPERNHRQLVPGDRGLSAELVYSSLAGLVGASEAGGAAGGSGLGGGAGVSAAGGRIGVSALGGAVGLSSE